jgi:hypothetical protein
MDVGADADDDTPAAPLTASEKKECRMDIMDAFKGIPKKLTA